MNYTTNRILEIPQDIKLELNNGALTLKAGSKSYMGNGTVRTTTGEPTLKNNGAAQMFLHITSGGTGLYVGYMTGGTVSERPSSPITHASYYNTNTRKCEYYNGSDWIEVSLPIAIVTRTEDGFSSVDQIFNGFGYIGSTVFALPGVKCLFADGHNDDGSYKSYIKTTEKLLTKTFGSETFNGFDCSLCCQNDTIDDLAWHVNADFDSESGYIKINNTEEIVKNLCPVFRFFINSSSDNGRISQFIPNPVDKLNWKSTELSGMSKPSNKYIGLTLGASGSTYTAPANGWFTCVKRAASAGQYLYLRTLNSNIGNQTTISNAGEYAIVTIPISAGDRCIVIYTATGEGDAERFRFVYDKGCQ